MGNKDRARRSSKRAAAKTLKEKRLAKKAKRDARAGKPGSVDRTFGH